MWTIPVPSPRAGQAPIDMPIVYCMLMAASGIPTGPPARIQAHRVAPRSRQSPSLHKRPRRPVIETEGDRSTTGSDSTSP